MNNGNPPNLSLNSLTDPRSIYGTALQQLQQQVPLSSLLNMGSNQQQQHQQQQQQQQQSQLQVLQSLLQSQQQPVQNQLNQSLFQSLGQQSNQPLHAGLLQNINGLSPSSLAGLSPDLQSQLIRSLVGGSNTSQNTDLLLAIEKQNILDRARALNQLEIRRALEREQEQNQARNQLASSVRQEAPSAQLSSNLRSVLDSSMNHPAMGQPLQVDVVARALTSSSGSTASQESSSADGTAPAAASRSPLPFAVGEGGVTDLRMVQDSTWESRFRDLMQFKLKHGNCNVPRRYKANPKLGVWVCSLRQQMTRGTLNKAKVERLNQIGFQWRITVIKGAQINPQIAKMDKWNENFLLVSKIKSETGSCTVPPTNRKLCKWVYKQRREMAKGKLSVEKQEKLNSIGFQWQQQEMPIKKPSNNEGADDDYVKISDSDDMEGTSVDV